MSESEQHNAVVRLIDEFPELLRIVLTRLGTPPPPGARVQSMPTNVSVQQDPLDNTLKGTRRHVDNAAVFAVGDEWKVCVVFEHQGKPSTQKIFRWLQYVAQALERANPAARPELEDVCPVKLVVVTANEETIRWSEKAYNNLARAHKEVGQEFAFRPVFVGPKQLPEITDPSVAQAEPALAVLTAAVHPHSLQAAQLALRSALPAVTEYQRNIIFAALVHCIDPQHVEALKKMSTEFEQYTDSFADRNLAQGMRTIIERQLAVLFPQFNTDPSVVSYLNTADIADLQRVADVLVRHPTWDQVLQTLSHQRTVTVADIVQQMTSEHHGQSQQPASQQPPEQPQEPEPGRRGPKPG